MKSLTRNGEGIEAFAPGDIIDYKVKAGRGRPTMGILIEKKDDSFVVQSTKGERTIIPVGSVLGKHVTRYTERQRRLL